MLSRLIDPRADTARCLAFMLALALAGQSASAQVDENDRLARCQNNRQALAYVENQLQTGGYWSREKIAQAQAAAPRLVDQMQQFLIIYHMRKELQRDVAPLDNIMAMTARLETEGRPLLEIVRPFGITCADGNHDCTANILSVLVAKIDQQTDAEPHRVRAEQAMASYRTNLIALRCDQAAYTSFSVAGTWAGSNGLTYQMSQVGDTIGWQVTSISETGTGSISGRSITASWKGNWGSGSSTGTVSVGPGGAANRIDWNNGVVFSR